MKNIEKQGSDAAIQDPVIAALRGKTDTKAQRSTKPGKQENSYRVKNNRHVPLESWVEADSQQGAHASYGSPSLALQESVSQMSNLWSKPRPEAYGKLDLAPPTSSKDASKIIKANAKSILAAGKEFGVNPAIIASCIYTEQTKNVNWIDHVTDRGWATALDTSIGIGQVKLSTARNLEDNGYLPKTEGVSYVYMNYKITRDEKIVEKLSDPETNVLYVAAELKYRQDLWKDQYPMIDGDSAILGTLYNLGDYSKKPNASPKPSPFGSEVKKNYHQMRTLLEME